MPKKHEGQRVLLVEDTRLYSIVLRHRLETVFGVEVTHCSTFAELKRALANAREGFDIAILDLCQSDATDGQALDYVIARNIAAIVFSATGDERSRERVLAKSNVEAYVVKDSFQSIEDLAAAVDRCLSVTDIEVLIVDPAAAASDLPSLLAVGGFAATTARGADEALAILDRSRKIELVIARSEPIAEGGYEFLARVRNLYGEDRLRVVGFSDQVRAGDMAAFLRGGGADFFHMPIDPADLAARLAHTQTVHHQIKALQRMASRDYLTDLLNRRYFFDRGPKLVDVTLRQGKAASMALMDIDHFKRLNDTYGHEIGDDVLKAVSRKLLSLVGEDQHLVARLGGEEFGILFAGIDVESAFNFCQLIRTEIGNTRIVADEEDLSITVSMGLATINGAETFDNYLNAADQYLYMAKNSGRNRIYSDYQMARTLAS